MSESFQKNQPPDEYPAPRAVTRLWGSGDLDALFRGADRSMLPWPRLRRSPNEQAPPFVLPAGRPTLEPVDPRVLWATQPWLVRHHAAYYLSGNWEHTGTTSADMGSAANRYPTISVEADGRYLIRTGHHRSYAALICGRPVLARLFGENEQSNAPGQGLIVTAHLWVSPHDETSAVAHDGVHGHRSAEIKTVSSLDDARTALVEAGLDDGQIADRLSMAETGRPTTNR